MSTPGGLGLTDAEVFALRERPWCDGCHTDDRAVLRVTRVLADDAPTLICSPCLMAWHEGDLRESGQRCQAPDCRACA